MKKNYEICQERRRLTRQVSMHTLTTYNELRLNAKFCDATIILDNGDTFPIHRSVLSSSSDYFRILFTTSLHEGEYSMIHLKTIENCIMELILQYIYMRQIDLNNNNVLDIMKTADYFCIDGLVQLCHQFLFECLGPHNCVTLLQFGAYYYFNPLVEAAYKYIIFDFMTISEQGNELMKLENEELKKILKNNQLNVKSEEHVWNIVLKWIDNDPENRISNLVFLLPEVRFGLMDSNYFAEKVKENHYVRTRVDCWPYIMKTIKFFRDQQGASNMKTSVVSTLAQPRYPFEVLFAIGGWNGAVTAAIEIYDLKSDCWVQISEEDPYGPRAHHGSVAMSNCIYVIGGFDGIKYLNSCRKFNTVTKSWQEIAPMNCKRCYVSVVSLNGTIYAMGGFDGYQQLSSAEKYDFERNQWTMIAPMHYHRSHFGAAVLNDRIYVVGGCDGRSYLATAEVYDADADTWSDAIPDMWRARSGVSCVAHHGYLYALGGFDGRVRTSSAERYDPATGWWTHLADMGRPRSSFAADVLDGTIFAAGGLGGRSLTVDLAERYEELADQWIQVKSMQVRRASLSMCVVKDLPDIESYIPLNSRNKLPVDQRNVKKKNSYH